MRRVNFRPSFDRLDVRITPSDGGMPMVPAYPIPSGDVTLPGEETNTPINYSDPGTYSGSGDPSVPVNYAQ